jgi:hypothetical protein
MAELPPEGGHPLLISYNLRIGELLLYFSGARERVGKSIPETQLSVGAGAPGLLYF